MDPWKDISRDKSFDVQEHVFAIKNSNLYMPPSPEGHACMFSEDKIKRAFIVRNNVSSGEPFYTVIV